MKRIWNTEWQDIKFEELNVNLTFLKSASSSFYSKFYDELFNRYNSFDDLPLNWIKEKTNTAKEISLLIDSNNSILSYGCGLGFVEKELVKFHNIRTIDAYDFSNEASKWIKQVKKVNTINTLKDNKKYDFIYCTQLIYALNSNELNEFLSTVKKTLNKNGIFLTIDTSANPEENGNNPTPFLENLLNSIRPLFWAIFKRNKFQFWGWERSNSQIIKACKNNGMKHKKTFIAIGQSFQIFTISNSK